MQGKVHAHVLIIVIAMLAVAVLVQPKAHVSRAL
jgi:hypothetical protein